VIVGRVTTDEEEQERQERTSKIRDEERRAVAEELGHADVPDLDTILNTFLNTIVADPCEHPDASECMLAMDPCAASPDGDECAMMTTDPAPLDPALLETYIVQDPCDADPAGKECQVFSFAGEERLAQMDDFNYEVLDPCQVVDAPFACEDEGEVERLVSQIYTNIERSSV
jgi:hypothetical protein